MDYKMFCYQCQETAKGTGCTVQGVCGKKSDLSAMMDMLLFAVRGVSVLATGLRRLEQPVAREVDHAVVDALFATITNANFDKDSLRRRVDHMFQLRDGLKNQAAAVGLTYKADEVTWAPVPDEYEAKGFAAGVLREQNEDVRSLKELTLYGLKGMAAYVEHAMRLGKEDDTIYAFIERALNDMTIGELDAAALTDLVLETGRVGVQAMALLDGAHTSAYGNPEMTEVNIGVGHRPGILISGHDMRDMEMLLQQTEGTGVDVYTHGEMLSAHYYPAFKKYKHFVGNYGNAWWKQREEFETFNGPIIFTTNCIVPPTPRNTYLSRMFTANSTGYPGCRHIEEDANGHKDFSEVIALAKTCQPPTEIEHGTIVGGFAHHQVFQLADKIVDAIRSGALRKFVVMGGCDGRFASRSYYTDYALGLPKDVVILTSGCAKYRYNKLGLGDINGIPRVLDAGQCNDSYTWAVVALKLKEIFALNDINDLPIVFNIAWYEQKAVIVLLALLSLGVKNIHIGPTLPAFLSPGVAKVLTETFGLAGNSTVEEDLKLVMPADADVLA